MMFFLLFNMESEVTVKQAPSGIYWTALSNPICKECKWRMQYRYHGNPRTLITEDSKIQIVQSYYKCRNEECGNEKQIVAKHPDILYKKKYSKQVFTKVIFLRYNKNYSVNQIIDLNPYLNKDICYEIFNSYRAVRRAGSDSRISELYEKGTKISVSIDGMEPEKGQPSLYTVRDTKNDTLLAGDFIENASADNLYHLVSSIETKYGLIIAGMLSDKQRSIIAMHDKYYLNVPHQYCTVHFMKNVTIELRDADKSLQKNLRSEVRSLSVFKTIEAKKSRKDSGLAEKEQLVLSETRKALLSAVNLKKKEMFDLAGIKLFDILSNAAIWLIESLETDLFLNSSQKFKLLYKHLSTKLAGIVTKYKDDYDFVVFANNAIHPMWNAVMNSHPKHPKRHFHIVIQSWRNIIANKFISKEIRGLMEKALKFALSYERGLFVWHQGKMPPTNNNTESFYNEKKGNYRIHSRNKKIGITLQLTGLEEMYIPKDLNMDTISNDFKIFGNKEYWTIRDEMNGRKSNRKFSRFCQTNIIDALESIFKKLKDKS